MIDQSGLTIRLLHMVSSFKKGDKQDVLIQVLIDKKIP